MAAGKASPKNRESATRYSQIKRILNAAAGGAHADYGLGAGRNFWDLPLEEFKNFSLYGVRLIAPAAAPSCCAGDAAQAWSRSRASGLIKGLAGAAPFDGSRLPRLPWNGHPVAETDVDFIADWIDDGCPPDDHLESVEIETAQTAIIAHVYARDIAEFDVMTGAGVRRGYRQGELRQRQNLDCMEDDEVERVRDAFRAIYTLDDFAEDRRSYNNQALIHQNHCQHGWERFLPWHRVYLYEFEQNLADFCPDVALPYWDFTLSQYWNDGEPQNGWILPLAFKAYLTPAAAEKLIKRLGLSPKSKQGAAFLKTADEKRLFTTQTEFFCYVINTIGFTEVTADPEDTNRQAMIDALLESNALWYPLRYPAQYKGAARSTR